MIRRYLRSQRIRRNNSTGIPGVSWDRHQARWIANIHTDDGRMVFYTKDFFEACCIRKSLELVHSYNK